MAPTIWPHVVIAGLLTDKGNELAGRVLHLTHDADIGDKTPDQLIHLPRPYSRRLLAIMYTRVRHDK